MELLVMGMVRNGWRHTTSVGCCSRSRIGHTTRGGPIPHFTRSIYLIHQPFVSFPLRLLTQHMHHQHSQTVSLRRSHLFCLAFQLSSFFLSFSSSFHLYSIFLSFSSILHSLSSILLSPYYSPSTYGWWAIINNVYLGILSLHCTIVNRNIVFTLLIRNQ